MKNFDVMCRLAEQDGGHPWLSSCLRYASLVDMGPFIQNAGWESDNTHLFRLPWKAVCLEDALSCCFLERCGTIGGSAYGAIPDRAKRIASSDVGLEKGDCFRFAFAQSDSGLEQMVVAECVYGGRQQARPDGKEPMVWGADTLEIVSRSDGVPSRSRIDRSSPRFVEVFGALVTQIIVATWQCVNVTQPGRWLLADIEGEKREKLFRQAKKIPRSHQRRKWLLITDEERRRVFRHDYERERDSSVTPHARRAHYRHIGENEDGTRRYTWVRSCWVGSTEAEIRGQRYRVELNL